MRLERLSPKSTLFVLSVLLEQLNDKMYYLLFTIPDAFLMMVYTKGLFVEWHDGRGAQPKLICTANERSYQVGSEGKL